MLRGHEGGLPPPLVWMKLPVDECHVTEGMMNDDDLLRPTKLTMEAQ